MQWQSFLEAVGRKVITIRLAIEIKTNMKRENELMAYLLADEGLRNFVSLWLDERQNNKEFKSAEKAKVFKAVGNKQFYAKNYTSCIQSYTNSALYALVDSEDLPIAIGNRSASLFRLEKYEECVKDIEHAIKLGYPEKRRYKLYVRAVDCYIKLGKRKLAEDTLQQLRDIINKSDGLSDMLKEEMEKQVAQLTSVASSMPNDADIVIENSMSHKIPELSHGENPDFPCASIAVERKYSPEKGRYVVATRDIKKGQTLFVEKPFAFVLLDHDKSNCLCVHCCHPYGRVSVPCTRCLVTMYCDVKCWNEAWSSYHRWECPGSQIGLWQQIGIAHIALKVLLRCTTTTDRVRFNEVQKLITNFNKMSPGDLVIYGVTAIMLTMYLSKYTDYFKVNDIRECLAAKFTDESYNFNCDILTEDGKRLYVSSLLFRHILQLVSNGHAITKLNLVASDKEKISTEQQDRVATAIYPSASMMNHSCDPNIINSFMDQYLIVKATKDIAPGEEVFNCYGPNFRRMSREQRQEDLKSQYCFTCKCEPCTIPEYQYFRDRFHAMKCPECSGAAVFNVHSCSLHCLDCGLAPAVNYQSELIHAQDLFDTAQVYIESEREEEALDKLKECLRFRRSTLYKYHEDITETLDLIGKVYAIMGRWLDSISYLEHSIAAVSERFGSSSVELANELNKLTDICIRYLQVEPNTNTKWYKNILKKTRRYLDRAEEILNLNYGPWNDACSEVNEKKKVLATLLKDFNI